MIIYLFLNHRPIHWLLDDVKVIWYFSFGHRMPEVFGAVNATENHPMRRYSWT